MSSHNDLPIPRAYWLIIGGRGPTPTRSAILRMASERKAAYRQEFLRKAAKREAQAKVKKEHSNSGLMDCVKTKLGLKEKETLNRQELMEKFGGKKHSLRRAKATASCDAKTSDDVEVVSVGENDDDGVEADDGAGANGNGRVDGGEVGEDAVP
ncbi:hypothetical protein AB5N19_05508 [Seiridium cardinale]|uniref:Uncharacterized protein n=1 Tax=Seiridium cardinale TaxID=138064 RepID=A0ABR2XDD0_9PEZI